MKKLNMKYDNVQLNVKFTKSGTRSDLNVITDKNPTGVTNENISLTLGKISKWYEALVPTGGSSGKILAWNSAGTAKWSDPLHPTITKSADTTSTASPAHGGTFTTVDSVTRDGNGHVTKINTKTVTLPSQYTHPTYSRSDTSSTVSPAHGGTFTAIDSVTSSNGHVTSVNLKTITLPAQYTHPTYTSKSSGLYKITVDGTGHVSGTAAVTKSDIPALDYVPNTKSGVITAINLLDEATANITSDDAHFISQENDGSTTNYYRRKFSGLWGYINGKISAETTGSGNAVTSVSYSNGKITATKGSTFSLSNHTHAYTVPQGFTIKTGSSDQSHITLQTLMTWLITTKGYITSNTARSLTLYTSWNYAGNDILQLTIDGTAYELQLAGVIIEFDGYASDYQTGTFRLRIHSSPTVSFTAASGYTQFPTSHIAEYTCNGSNYSPTWKMLVDKGDTVTRTGGGASGTWGISISGTAASANKLNTNAGSNRQPVYFTGGIPVAVNNVVSGTYHTAVPFISSDGVMEVGKYIDFHEKTSTNDFDYRLTSTTTGLIAEAVGASNALTIKSAGYAQIQLATSASDKAYTATGIVGYPLTTTGLTTIFNFGGNTVVGGGESASTLYDNNYDTIKTSETETLYLSSDSPAIHLITNAQTYSNIKVVKIDSGNVVLDKTGAIIQTQEPTSNYTTAIRWWKGGTNPGDYPPSIGQHNTGGDSTNPGSICILPYQTTTSPWGGNVGLFIKKDHVYIDGTELSKVGHNHDYLPLAGGTMTGDITFTSISGDSYPIASKGIKWGGGTDAIDMYYNLRTSDAGELIINMRDDYNVRTSFAYNGTVKSYIDTNGVYNGTATIANKLGTANKGSATKGIYLNAGAPAEMTYSLGSTVNGGTANQLAYYSGANAISATHDGTNTGDSLYFKTGTNAKSARQIMLGIYGQTYGNDASTLISGTAGVLSYGDGGPQIDFSTSSSVVQAGSLIFTDHDAAGTGASWHFVSNQTDWNVISKRFHARTSISIGTNTPNTSYNLYVNGTANITGAVTFGGSVTASTFTGNLTGNALKTGVRWNAVSQGQKWSRLYYSAPAVDVEGSNGILTISCTRGNTVINAIFLVYVSHPGSNASHITELASTNYSTIRCRVVSNSNGAYYFEIYDTATSIASGTAQTWHCCFVPLTDATITTYTAFTDGSTIPSNFAAANDFTTTVGSASAAIKAISRSGTTFTATRQDGTTFTFNQQDNNTTYTIATGDNNGQIKVTPSSGSAYNIGVKGLGSAAYTAETSYLKARSTVTTEGGVTGWSQIGINQYNDAYPDGVTNKIYGWGAVVSMPAPNARFDLYYNHNSSTADRITNGLQYRTGWNDDKKAWRMLLDNVNYTEYMPYKKPIKFQFNNGITNGYWAKLFSANYSNYNILEIDIVTYHGYTGNYRSKLHIRFNNEGFKPSESNILAYQNMAPGSLRVTQDDTNTFSLWIKCDGTSSRFGYEILNISDESSVFFNGVTLTAERWSFPTTFTKSDTAPTNAITAVRYFALDNHTHSYAGSSSAGGPATISTKLSVPRVTEDSKAFAGCNTCVIKEYQPNSANIPSNAWYHIMSSQGNDTKYGTQLALGMTADGVYYRRYDSATWGSWFPIGRFTATPTTGQVVITDGTTGGVKSSGYTIATSVPSNAVFTDTNTKVNVTLATTTKAYLLGTSTTPTSTAQAVTSVADTGVYLGTTAGMLCVNGTVCANVSNSNTAGGLSLYSTNPDEYGIIFRGTAQKGKHGYVQDDWATYFTMNNQDGRGWVFHKQSNVASISGGGNAVFNGSVTVGGNTTNTSGCRMQYNSSTQSLDFVFV